MAGHRTQITADGDTRATVRQWNDDAGADGMGAWVVTEYMRPLDGGYVRINDGRQYPQVCEGLAGTGNTLICGAATPLIRLIRREYHRSVRAERRALYGRR